MPAFCLFWIIYFKLFSYEEVIDILKKSVGILSKP